MEYADLYREVLGDLLMHLWELHDRPKTTYRVHMLQEVSVPQVTLVHAWFLGLANIAQDCGMHVSMHWIKWGFWKILLDCYTQRMVNSLRPNICCRVATARI